MVSAPMQTSSNTISTAQNFENGKTQLLLLLNLCNYWCVIIKNNCLNIIRRKNAKCENGTKLDDIQFIIKQF